MKMINGENSKEELRLDNVETIILRFRDFGIENTVEEIKKFEDLLNIVK